MRRDELVRRWYSRRQLAWAPLTSSSIYKHSTRPGQHWLTGYLLTYFLTYLTSSPANFVTYFDTPCHIKLLVQFVVYCHIVVNGYRVMQCYCLSHYWKYVTCVSSCCTSMGWMCNTHLSSSFNKQQLYPFCFCIGRCFCSVDHTSATTDGFFVNFVITKIQFDQIKWVSWL